MISLNLPVKVKYLGYKGTATYQKDQGIYFGKASNVKDVIQFAAARKEDLQAEFEKSIHEYLEFCLSVNKAAEIPQRSAFKIKYKLLKKQIKLNKELNAKNKQLEDLRRFLDKINKDLENISGEELFLLRREVGYVISCKMTEKTWLYVPGMADKSVDQIKLEVLNHLG